MEELELRAYDMQSSNSIDVFVKGSARFIYSFELGYGDPVDSEHEQYAKNFVALHNCQITRSKLLTDQANLLKEVMKECEVDHGLRTRITEADTKYHELIGE